jgi:hypothetical protein
MYLDSTGGWRQFHNEKSCNCYFSKAVTKSRGTRISGLVTCIRGELHTSFLVSGGNSARKETIGGGGGQPKWKENNMKIIFEKQVGVDMD